LTGTDTSAAFTAAAATLTVGRRATGATNYWNGIMGELVFHSTATPWTAQQVSDLYASGTIPSGASYWLFNGDVLDGSGNGNNGTLTGGTYIDRNAPRTAPTLPRKVVKDYPTSLAFNGSSTGVTLPVSCPSTGFSIAFKARVRKFTNNDRIIDFQDAGPTHGFSIILPSTNPRNVRFDIYSGAGNVANVQSTKEMSIGMFHSIVVTFEPNSVKLYQDGVLQAEDTSATMTQPAGSVTLGKRVGGSNFFNGWLNTVVFYHRPLTSDEVENIAYSDVYPDDKAAEYLFENSLSDTSGNGHDGVGIGTIDYVGVKPSEARRPLSAIPPAGLDFINPTTSVVVVSDTAVLRPETTGQFSMVATFKIKRVDNNVLPRIMEKGSHYLCFMGDMTNGKRTRLAVEVADTGATPSEFWGSTMLSLDKWYTVVATFNTGVCRMWLNGAEESIANLMGPYNGTLESTVGSNLKIGNSDSTNRNLPGVIARTAFYTRSLTESEAISVCNGGELPSDAAGKWNMDELTGNPQDTSGNGNHGVNSGAVWRTFQSTRTAV